MSPLLAALALGIAPLSLQVLPETPRAEALRSTLARMLEEMGSTVLTGRDAEVTCAESCVHVVVQLGAGAIELSAARAAEKVRETIADAGGQDIFDEALALALQIRALVEQLPPPRRHRRPLAASPVPPRAAPPAEPRAPPSQAAPAVPQPPPSPPAVSSPAPSPPPAVSTPVPPQTAPRVPQAPARFGLGAGYLALLSKDPDFQLQGLLLTARFPVVGPVEGSLSVGLLPARRRSSALGGYAVNVLPVVLLFSLPTPVRYLRFELGADLEQASIDYVSGGLDSTNFWSAGPVAGLSGRFPLTPLLSLELRLGAAFHPFRQEEQIGEGTLFVYPTWSFLGTAAVELNLRP